MKSSQQQGFTIVELLVAMGLGLTLIAGAVNVFISNNRSAMQDEQVSIMMDNGRFLSRLISRELAMAGFWGKYLDVATIAQDASAVVSLGNDCGDGVNPWALDLQALQLVNNATQAAVNANFDCLPDEIQAGTDVIAIKRVADRETPDAALQAGTIYMRTNGAGATMFGGTVPPVLGGTEVNWTYVPTIFYVRNYSITVGDGLPALCMATLRTVAAAPTMRNGCLVDGVEDLQIEFGIDDDRDFVADHYDAAPTVAEMRNAVSARIFVLARSIAPVPNYVNDKTYNLGAKVVAPANDGFYRRVFTTTVVLRNPTNLAGVGA